MKIEEELQTKHFESERHKAALNIIFTAYSIKAAVSSSLKPLGISLEQYNVLRILRGAKGKPLCVKDIAGRTMERSSNVPRILDRLAEKELITRTQSVEDGRETLVILTLKGDRFIESAKSAVSGIDADSIMLSEQDAEKLNDLLDKSRG